MYREKKGKVGYQILSNLVNDGFDGTIIPVNPSADEILGVRCYHALKDYSSEVDLCVIIVPAPKVLAVVEESIQAGAKAIVVISGGFKETNDEGKTLEDEILKTCKLNRIRLLGPNCLGLINAYYKLNVTFAKLMPKAGSISIISQSGAICAAIMDWAMGRNLGLSKVISIGNKADLNENDFLSYLANDDHTKVIACYLESIASGVEFIKAAENAATKKPVLILRAGVTESGSKAASSHTGALSGKGTAFGAAFSKAGVISVDTFESLLDCAIAFSMQPLPKGNRVAIITNAGGLGILAADAVETSGMRVAHFKKETTSMLRNELPSAAAIDNPIDVLGDASPDKYVMALNAAQEDESVDAVVCLFAPQGLTRPTEIALAIAENIKKEKPVLAAFLGGKDAMSGREELSAHGLPVYESPERAIVALKSMYDYSLWKRKPHRVVTRFPVNRRRVDRILRRYVKKEKLYIGEADSKEILRAYNFKVPLGHIAATPQAAVKIADKIGYPVAMKILSPDIIHKSDVGGVKLRVPDAEAVHDAFDIMMLRIKQRFPEAHIEGIYVEQMCRQNMEVIIGMNRDPQFGPMLMFGLGGVFVEVLKDVTFHLAPIALEEATQMLKNTKSYRLLEGTRGQKSVDMLAAAECLQRISQLATDFPIIVELDINPLLVGTENEGAWVADARMTISRKGGYK